MSAPVQILRQKNDDLQNQIHTITEHTIKQIIERAQSNESSDSAVLARVQKLETELTNLLDYLKNWASVGNVNMNDIKEHVCSDS